MSEYKIIDNYLVFKELNSDSIGTNYRAGEIEDNKVSKHLLLTEVYPFISGNPDSWKRVNILMDGIKKSNIPNLYTPQQIIKDDEKALLVFPLMKARTLEQVLEDSTKKDIPLNFDLTFSMAIAIADLIDTGSSIVVSGQKSFHGFLTPDNILVDYDGKIYLKNYGIYPYLSKNEEIFNEMVNKYGAWIAPEFLRKERLVPQSDIYHLGYIIYRILTGEYFSYPAGEDFETKLSNISFSQHLPSSDKDFLTNIINFFKKTLNPDPSKRFANVKEFKDFIAQYFHIEELSSVTFNLAYFMNSLYLEAMEQENKELEEELAYSIPVEEEVVPEDRPSDSQLAENILAGLEEKKSSKMKVIIPIVAAVIIVAVVALFYIMQSQKAAEEQRQLAETLKRNEARNAQLKKEMEERDRKFQEQLKSLEEKKTTTEEEQKAKEEEIKKLKEWRQLQEKKEQDRIKQQEEELKKQQELEEQKKKEEAEAEKKRLAEAEKKKKEEERKRLEAERNKVTPGQLIPLIEATEKPVKTKGKDPKFPFHIKNRYSGNKDISVRANILIDENGKVTNVRIFSKIPDDIKTIIEKTLTKWEYSPAKKNKVAVKVWQPVSLKIDF